MRIRSVMVATLFLVSSLGFAQVCPSTPGSVCLVPSRSATITQATTYTLPSTMTSTYTTVPYGATGTMPMVGMTPMPMYSSTGACPMYGSSTMSSMPLSSNTAVIVPYSGGMYGMNPSYSTMPSTGLYSSQPMAACPMMGTSTMGTMPMYSYQTTSPYMMGTTSAYQSTMSPYMMGMTSAYPSTMMPMTGMTNISAACQNVSPDVACINNQIRSLQGTVRATSIEMRGQDLVSRMNRLMAGEMIFRQQIAANPNMPGAQAVALTLSQEADALNRDIASFNQQLSLIPMDQRPYLASDLNAFTMAYWDPTMQRFSTYSSQFASTGQSAYQPAFAANPWLQNWQMGYQTSLNNLSMAPQAYASANWWSTTRVLGSTEVYPGGMIMQPSGVIYVPAGSMGTGTMGAGATTMTPAATTGTMGAGTTTTGTTMAPEQTETLPATMPTTGTGY